MVDRAKAKRIVDALCWLPLDADSNDGLEDILNEEQLDTVKGRLVSALLDPDVYDMPIAGVSRGDTHGSPVGRKGG